MNNRSLEFRAFDKISGTWCFGSGIVKDSVIKDRYWLMFNECDGIIIDFIETIGQWIGLKDINGNKIFEGDIVKYFNPYSNKWYEYVVKWDDMWVSFGLFEKGNEWCKESDWCKLEKIEIVGNIFNNMLIQ